MKTIHNFFQQQVKKNPDKVAIIYRQHRISYHSLNILSDTLASYLQKKGAHSGQPIAFFLPRSPDAIIAMLAILKTGGAYVPIDTNYPAERISLMLQDCDPVLILTSSSYAKHLPETNIPRILVNAPLPETSTKSLLPEISQNDPAYILYTSGTTGKPKGVIIPHRAVIRLIHDQDYIKFGPDKTFLQLSSLSFDAATFEIWGALLHGGTCLLYPDNNLPDPNTLQQLIKTENVSTIWLTTTLFNTLITTAPDSLKGVNEILVGGEALSVFHIREAQKKLPDTTLINGYGPTENTTFTTYYPIPSNLPADCTSIPIGKPLKNTSVYVLDDDLNPVPQGEVGELYTGGDGLALGYLNHPDLTAEKFILNPYTHGKDELIYKTGDLVRQLPDGNLDYVGRTDDQVKIRGFRIELDEIISAILNHPNIEQTVVVQHVDERQHKHIIAYVTYKDEKTHDEELRHYLNKRLPSYMIPSQFIELESIPLNPNGKLDKERLPPPFLSDENDYSSPTSKMERQIATIWNKLLNKTHISITDNFFDIGGTSLLVIELVSIINRSLDISPKIGPVDLYQYPTIKGLAAFLNQHASCSRSTGMVNRAKHQKSAFTKFKRLKRT